MVAKRIGRAWGNALGGYKFQNRNKGGQFGSGFVGSVPQASLTPGARRARYLKKQKNDQRKKTVAKVAGVTAVAAVGGAVAYKNRDSIGRAVGNFGLNNADFGTVKKRPDSAGSRQKPGFVAGAENFSSSASKIRDAMIVTASTTGTAVAIKKNIEQITGEDKRKRDREAARRVDPQTGLGPSLADNGAPPQTLLKSISASEQARLANNRQVSEMKRQRESLRRIQHGPGLMSERGVVNVHPHGELHQALHAPIPADHVHQYNARGGSRGRGAFSVGDNSWLIAPQEGIRPGRNARATRSSKMRGGDEVVKMLNGEALREGSFSGGDWLEEQSHPRKAGRQGSYLLPQDAKFVGADVFGDDAAHRGTPQAAAKLSLKAVGLPSAVDGKTNRSTSRAALSGMTDGIPAMDYAGNPINPDRERQKAANRNAGMKNKRLREALAAYEKEYGKIDPNTGETSGGPIENVADLISLKSENPDMFREDFVHLPSRNFVSPTPYEVEKITSDNPQVLAHIANSSEMKKLRKKYKGGAFAPPQFGDLSTGKEGMYYKDEYRSVRGNRYLDKKKGKRVSAPGAGSNEYRNGKNVDPAINRRRNFNSKDMSYIEQFLPQMTSHRDSANEVASRFTVPDGIHELAIGSLGKEMEDWLKMNGYKLGGH